MYSAKQFINKIVCMFTRLILCICIIMPGTCIFPQQAMAFNFYSADETWKDALTNVTYRNVPITNYMASREYYTHGDYVRWHDDGQLWARFNGLTARYPFNYDSHDNIYMMQDEGEGGISSSYVRKYHVAETVRLRGEFKVNPAQLSYFDTPGHHLSFTIDSYHRDREIHCDDGYWIFIYPKCIASTLNENNFWDYYALGFICSSDGSPRNQWMMDDTHNKIYVYGTHLWDTVPRDNAGKAIKNGWEAVKDRPDFDGTFYFDVFFFNINDESFADRLVLGMDLDGSANIPSVYNITYNGNGATGGSTAPQTKQANSTINLRSNGFSRTGYTFVRWNTNASNTGTAYNQGAAYSANASLNLYAIWQGNSYTNYLYYNANGGSGAPGTQTASVTYPNTAKTFTISSTKPTRTGYTFMGWSTSSTASSASYSNGGSITVGSNQYLGNQQVTLYAVWKANTYNNTLNYNTNKPGNAPTTPSAVGADTVKVTFPNTKYRHTVKSGSSLTGFTFLGWYTASSGGTELGSAYDVGVNNYAGDQSETVYAQWRANKYKNTLNYNSNRPLTASTVPTNVAADIQTVTYPDTRYIHDVKAGPVMTGYTFLGWYAKISGGDPIGSRYAVGVNNYANNQSDTVYAHWVANKYWVTYDKNAENAVLIGEPKVKVAFDSAVDLNINNHRAERHGWTFLGWHTNPASQVIYNEYILRTASDDVVMYAIYRRDVKLRLAEDHVTSNPSEASSKTFNRRIFTKEDTFKFNDAEFTAASSRTQRTYTVQFYNNGESSIEGMGDYIVDGRTLSTDLKSDNTILATRYFVGWSEKEQRLIPLQSHQYNAPDYEGTVVGTSGSWINAKSNDLADTYNTFNVVGNNGNVNITAVNNTITLYPQYARTYVKLPDARRRTELGPDDGNQVDGNQEDTFIGWFTKPQPADGGTGDGGVYYGKAGDIVRIDADVKLYPWFNIAPVITNSVLGDDLEAFHEGQCINYSQLLSLISTYDTDNPREVGPEGYVSWDGTKRWLDLYTLNASAYLDDLDKTNGWHLTDAQKQEILNTINRDIFWPKLTSITYYEDGTDPQGNLYGGNHIDNQNMNEIHSRGLMTDKEHVGKIVLHYEITDNGTFVNNIKIMTGVSNPSGGKFDIDSPITVKYDLEAYIKFNQLPKLSLIPTYMYTGDEKITKDTIEQFLWAKQDASDACDDRDSKPWWYKSETSPALDDSIKIVSIYDIHFASGYEIDKPEACALARTIKDVHTLFSLKDTDYETFSHITDFKVEWDCVDQWGKTASGYLMPGFDYESNPNIDAYNVTGWIPGQDRPVYPGDQPKYGMDKTVRSTTVIMFNNKDDYELMKSNAVVAERMRYIDSSWADYLSEESYWGDERYGRNKLQKIFENYNERSSGETLSGVYDDNNRSIYVKINDYQSSGE